VEVNLPVERGGETYTVGDHQEPAPGSRHQVTGETEHVVRGRLVEISSGLVGEQKQWFLSPARGPIATRCCCPPDNCSG